MLSAKIAKNLARNFEVSNELLRPRQLKALNDQDGNHKLLEIALAGIYDNVRNGFKSHITRALDAASVRMLISHGYTVEKQVEEDDWYYEISW